MNQAATYRIRADWVLAARDQIYTPGQLTIRAGRVLEVGKSNTRHRDSADLDLEGYALLPGLVNAHTHLEFSDLSEPLPAGDSFPAWIRSVIQQRLGRGAQSQALLMGAIAQGLDESRRVGVAALADIVTPPWTPALLAEVQRRTSEGRVHPSEPSQPSVSAMAGAYPVEMSAESKPELQRHLAGAQSALPGVIACLETLGLTTQRREELLQWSDATLAADQQDLPAQLIELALSPHAPYSTPTELWDEAARICHRDQRLMVMHLAESPAERQWIDRGTGPMAEMLERIGAAGHRPSPDWILRACTQLARAARALVIHGNYLSDQEMDQIARHRERTSVVYCPRTHAHFAHAAYPLVPLVDRGIRVVLGTDSRSSNPDLNLWQEAAHALTHHGSLSPSRALDAITQSAAEALGIVQQYGTLVPGSMAAINLLPTFGYKESSQLEALLARNFAETRHPIPMSSLAIAR